MIEVRKSIALATEANPQLSNGTAEAVVSYIVGDEIRPWTLSKTEWKRTGEAALEKASSKLKLRLTKVGRDRWTIIIGRRKMSFPVGETVKEFYDADKSKESPAEVFDP